jgi:hypothetical protein
VKTVNKQSRQHGTNVGRLCVTLDVTYALNGQSVENLKDLLNNGVLRAIGDGMLTGQTEAAVENYSVDVAVAPERLSEQTIARLMAHRIETGELAPDDIPVRLARYGLMNPNAFVAEMRERMKPG